MLSINTIDSVLKSYYLDAICAQLNGGVSPFYAAVEKTAAEISGKNAIVPVEYGLCGGLGTTAEDGALPEAGESMRVALTVPLRNIYGVIDITDKVLRANRDNASGLVNVLNNEVQTMVRSAQFNLNRMLWMSGSGLLATAVTPTGSLAPNQFAVDDTRYLSEGMSVDIYTGNTIKYANVRIANVDHINGIVNVPNGAITASNAVAAGDKIYIQKSKDNEVNGVPYLFSTSGNLYFNVNKNTYPGIQPCTKSLNGALTVDAMQEFSDDLSMRSGVPVNMIVCSLKTRRQYLNQLMLTRTNIDYLNLDGGFQTLSFNGIPVCGERFVGDGTMYFLNTDAFKLVQLCDWEWLQGENGSILSQIDRKAVYTATLVKYANLVSTYPRGQGALTNITAPAA